MGFLGFHFIEYYKSNMGKHILQKTDFMENGFMFGGIFEGFL